MKVVCTHDGDWEYPGPVKGEIVEIESSHIGTYFPQYTFYFLVGYHHTFPSGDRVDYNAYFFRPIDYSIGEKVCEYITKECEKIKTPETVTI